MRIMRKMVKYDLDTITEIEKLVFGEDYWSKESFYGELNNPISTYLVCDEGGIIIGYAGYQKIIDEFHITNFCTIPQARRMGVGKTMMGEILQRAKDEQISKICLEVRASNTPAINLYKSFGFVTVGLRPKYYSNIEDAILMDLAL